MVYPETCERCSPRIRAGAKLNGKHIQSVKHLIRISKVWREAGDVSASDLGRTAAKVETIEEALVSVENALSKCVLDLPNYCNAKKPRSHHVHSGICSKDFHSVVVGRLHSDPLILAKDIDPNRLQFRSKPGFDLCKIYDSVTADFYRTPPPPRPQRACRRTPEC